MRPSLLLVGGLAAVNAVLLVMVAAWALAVYEGDGEIRLCVDCLGEGLFEVALLAFAWAAFTVGFAYFIERYRRVET